MSVVGGSDDFSKYKPILRTGVSHLCRSGQLSRLGVLKFFIPCGRLIILEVLAAELFLIPTLRLKIS
jgi:hypothetical protein